MMNINEIGDYIFLHTKMDIDLRVIERNLGKFVLIGDYWINFDPDNLQIVDNVPRDIAFFRYFMNGTEINKDSVGMIVWSINHASGRHRKILRRFLVSKLEGLKDDLAIKEDLYEIDLVKEQIKFVEYILSHTDAVAREIKTIG